MWTATSRAQHSRAGLRFSSDVTDAEWAVLQPLLPPRTAVGRRPSWPVRDIANAIFYVLRGGVTWRMLPPCFPPRQTVYGWFAAWRDAGVWQTINHHLIILDRERSGREASPSAAVITLAFADTAYAGPRVASATGIAIQIVRKIPGQVGFEVHRDAGSSNAASPGSIATPGSQRTSRRASPQQPPSSTPHQP